MYCSQCATKLTPDDVYCPNCAKPIASFAFDGAQVEPLETPTVVRIDRATLTPSRSSRAWLPFLTAILGLGFLTAIVGLLLFSMNRNDREQGKIAGPQNVNVYVVPTPQNTPSERPTPKPDRTPTPIDYDAEYERIQRNENAALSTNRAAANAMAAANRVLQSTNAMPNIAWPPPFDRNGQPLRAICKNGEPSYWQFDEAATCLLKGGVRIWVRR